MKLWAAWRERRSVGELSRALAESRERGLVLEDVAGALVTCVKALMLDLDELGAARLKAELDETLGRVRAAAPPHELAEQIGARQRDALVFAQKERRYLEDRDGELKRIIGVLTDGLSGFGQGNASYNRRLLANGVRLEAASQLGDIVKMRQVIVKEVGDLREAVAQKQAADTKHTADLDLQVAALRKDLVLARTAAATDPLTGAANRAAFDAELVRLCDIAAAGGEGFALMVVDVDHFKSINDRHGHPVGDRVLMGLVGFCREHVRRGDMVARWGGEEFAILLPSASIRVAFRKAQHLLKALAKREWSVSGDIVLQFTASAGVIAWRAGASPQTLIEEADRALYAAKHGGRNRAKKA
jgi:diguanylate cyclase